MSDVQDTPEGRDKRRSSAPRRLAPALLAALVAVAMTWPLTANLGSDVGHDLGDPLFQAWQVSWIGHALAREPLDLFQANILWPEADSLAFSDALVGYAPAGLAAQEGPHSALVVYNLLFLLAYALAFLGAYLLARELGAHWAGGLVAGAAYAYAPWRLAHNGHLNVLSSGGIPLALFLLVRGYRRRSPGYVVAGWLVTAWQITLGFTLGLQLGYLLAVLALVAAVAWLRRGRPRLDRTLAIGTAAGVCAVILVATFQARPYFRVADEHPEATRTPDLVAGYSPPLRGFLAAPEESLLWGSVTSRVRDSLGWPPEETLFPGVAVVVLAGLGLWYRRYPRPLRIGLVVGIALCAVLSVGLRDVEGAEKWLMPYRLVYELAPGWDAVRTPGRINTLTSLGIALLAAGGASLAVSRLGRHRTSAGRATAAVLTGVILLEGLGPLDHPRVPEAPPGRLQAVPPELHIPAAIEYDPLHTFWSTGRFPQIVNGIGAFEPALLERVRDGVRGFPDRRSVAGLRALGVRTVVFHPELAAETPWAEVTGRPIGNLPVEREATGGVVLYRLSPP